MAVVTGAWGKGGEPDRKAQAIENKQNLRFLRSHGANPRRGACACMRTKE